MFQFYAHLLCQPTLLEIRLADSERALVGCLAVLFRLCRRNQLPFRLNSSFTPWRQFILVASMGQVNNHKNHSWRFAFSAPLGSVLNLCW